MSGYSWDRGMSNNAVAAYSAGELPASKAARQFGFKSVAALRRHIRPSSWHHTSKFYNSTDFFDVSSAIDDKDRGELRQMWPDLTRTGRAMLLPAIIARMWDACTPKVRRHSTYSNLAQAVHGTSYCPGCKFCEAVRAGKMSVLQARNAIADETRAQKLDAARAKLVAQRDCSRPVARKQGSWSNRIHQLRTICGDHGAKLVESALKSTGAPLTEQNWRNAHDQLYVRKGTDWKRR